MTVNTIYDRNSYTVRFIDSFTGEVIKSQTLKYKDAALAPVVTAPEGYNFTSWDKAFDCVESDLNVYTVYEWADTEHSATIDSVEAVRDKATVNGVDLGAYTVNITVTNRINSITNGRLVAVLKSADGVILTSTESSAFALDAEQTSKPISFKIIYPELAYKLEVYMVNDFSKMGKMSKIASADIDNSEAWSDWITYDGDTPPMESSDTVEVETDIKDGTPTKAYYRYQIKDTLTSYDTSVSGYTQDGYTLQKASTGTIDYVSSWPSGFDKGNAWYKKMNVSPKSASESATQKVTIDSTTTASYLYWHWCRGASLSSPLNRTISYSKTSTFNKFHCFNSTKNATTYTDGAYKYVDANMCKDTYWWGKIPVKRQTYTIYNKLYNYSKLSEYSDWIEYEGTVPVTEGGSAGSNKTYANIETKTVEGTTEVKLYRYKTLTAVAEPTVTDEQRVTISGNVGAEFAGRDASVWAYKFDQASDYTIEYTGNTVVAEDGSINIENAVLREAPTVSSGDYTVAVSVEGQERAVEIGKIEAPKPEYTVTFYDFDNSVIDTQVVKEGDTAVLPDKSLLNVPAGSRFTNWSESVVNVKSNMNVYPESETETYTVAVVNWEVQTVELKKFKYGAELIIDSVPEGKEGYITEWVVKNAEDEYVTVSEFTEAGGVVTGDMVVVTRSTPEQHNVTILDVDKDKNIYEDINSETEIEDMTSASEKVISNGDYIDFTEVQETIEEDENIIFLGWIDAYTGEEIESTEVTESMTIYPSYVFAETAEIPASDIETGEYDAEQTVTLTSETENAVIWYTTDGTDPKTSSTAVEYKEPIKIDKSCVLYYYASALGMNDSETAHETYAINAEGKNKYHVVEIVMPELDSVNEDKTNTILLVKDGTTLPVDVCEVIDGYEIGELFFDEALTEAFFCEDEVIGESMTLYAKYTPKKYKVTFIDHDGTVLSEQTVAFTSAAEAPEVPTREGYRFAGWDNDFDSISGDTVLNAKYIAEDEYAEVSLNRSRTISLNVGGMYGHLSAAITPDVHSDYSLEWSSSNEAVATVDENGIIKAVGIGEAVITVTIPYTGASDSCNVKVAVNPDESIVIKAGAAIGFDDARNVRGIEAGQNTVAEVLSQFENENLIIKDKDGNELSDTDLVGTGAVICLYDGEELLDSVKAAVLGDFNCDGIFDNKDIVMMNQYVLEKRTADEIQMIAIDVNGDGNVNNRDCGIILRYSAGKENI